MKTPEPALELRWLRPVRLGKLKVTQPAEGLHSHSHSVAGLSAAEKDKSK